MSDSAQPELDVDSLRLELQEAFGTFRHLTSLLTQLFGGAIGGATLLLAYGFSQKKAGILLLAALVPLGGLLAYLEIMTQAVPIVYIAIKLEKKLLPGDETLMATFARIRLAPFFSQLVDTSDPEDPKIGESILALPRWRWIEKRIALFACGAIAVLLLLFLLTLTIFNYPFS